jgi:hypothetical protein
VWTGHRRWLDVATKPQPRTAASMLADAVKYETALANDDKRRASELYEQTGQANKPALMRLPYVWRCPVDVAHLVHQTRYNSPHTLQLGNKLDRFLNLHAPGKRELTNAVENRRNKRARNSGQKKQQHLSILVVLYFVFCILWEVQLNCLQVVIALFAKQKPSIRKTSSATSNPYNLGT